VISKITKSLTTFFTTADGELAYHKYEEMTKTEGFKIHRAFLTEIGNGLLGYMMTQRFTDLDEKQKDVEQRAIFECKELIEFLLDPIKGLKRHNLVAAHNKRMQQTAPGAHPKRE